MEEMNFMAWTSIVAILLLLFFLLFRHKPVKKSGKVAMRLPPGGRGWPLIGHTLELYKSISSSHPPTFVEEQAKRYGKIFSCRFFTRKAVISADPEFNRFVMLNEGKLFQSSYPKSFRDLVGKNGVITSHGEEQRKLHRLAVNILRQEKLSSSLFWRDVQVVILQALNTFHDNKKLILQDVCRKVAIGVIVNQLFGVTDESDIDEMSRLFSDFVDGCLSIPIKVPGFAYHTAMKAREAITKKIKIMIKSTRERDQRSKENGVLGRLIEEENLSDSAISDFIMNLTFAWNETTAKTMLFAIYFLTKCPDAMEKLQDEQNRIRSRNQNNLLEWEDYEAMPYIQCVINETLRLSGTAIWLMREAKEDVEYQDFLIPKGSMVIPFLSAVHLDESIYQGALTFNPSRWMNEENKDKYNWRTSSVFTPFGGGPRYCPGAGLARMEISLFLHHFVTKYRWVQLKEDRMSFFPSARLVNGFEICITETTQAS